MYPTTLTTSSRGTVTEIALAALVLLTLIVFSGAAVRLTGSGLGCPEWPKCTDERLVAELDTHGLIEFVNRVFSGLVALSALAAGLLAYFRVPCRRDLMLLGLLLPLGVLGQGVLGGLTVLFLLPVPVSVGHASLAQFFFCLVVAIAFFTSRFSGSLRETPSPLALRAISKLLLGAVFVQIVIGALMRHLGAGMAIADFPSGTTTVPETTAPA